MDLENIRREYELAELDADHLAPDPMIQFDKWLQQALASQLSDDPTAMALTTVNPEGQPYSRTVLLKSYDHQGLIFYTNLESRKAQHIAQNPKVCLLFTWLPLERQVLINGCAETLGTLEALNYFRKRPRDSQLAAWSSRQSRSISSRQLLDEAFQTMKRKFTDGEIPLPPFWGGYKVVPTQVEFWQGRRNRLHDRFVYQLETSNQWRLQRWQP